MKKYDYLIVGAGLFGSVFAREMTDAGKRCLVVDKRDHVAGNAYTEMVEGITVHRYGAHIFTPTTRLRGIMSIGLLALIALPTVLSPTTRVSYTIYHSI